MTVGDVAFGGGAPFALIAGPCVIESRESTLRHAERIAAIARECGVALVFKSSFDKANRTSVGSFRGQSMEDGLRILEEVRGQLGLPVLTDVHTEEQARAAGEVVDCLQIPAFLCRQTDLLVAAGRTGRTVNVKKGQFLAPDDVRHLIEKVRSTGNEKVMVTERGTSFGYHALVVDFAGFPTMRAAGQPLVFDATHSVQRPSGAGGKSGGDRTKVPYLARAAVACGVDGLFMEVHEDPDAAPSDGPNMLRLGDLSSLLHELRRIEAAVAPRAATRAP
ncbi:MAG: 3-deoxy-8-phosphooctulonate synthase [Planctomycetota bacterium]